MSSRSPNTDKETHPKPDTTTGKTNTESNVTTKYSTGKKTNTTTPQPDCFTDNSQQLRRDFLNLPSETNTDTTDTPQQPPTEPTTNTETPVGTSDSTPTRIQRNVPGGKTYKYADLIDKEKLKAIEQQPEEETHNAHGDDACDLIVKGNFHSEIRFLERGDLTHEDAPETLREAWNQGVQVGVDHFDREDFYGYKRARYNEVANIVMLMNDDGMIETALTVFEDTMVINTAHLHRCGDPECGRLYDTTDGSLCCHWCGYSEATGRLPTEAELLPKTRTSSEQSTHSLDTTCDDCGETFNTLTRLRLHDC